MNRNLINNMNATNFMVFISAHKLLELKNISTIQLYYNIKFLQLNNYNFDMCRPFILQCGALIGVLLDFKNAAVINLGTCTENVICRL